MINARRALTMLAALCVPGLLAAPGAAQPSTEGSISILTYNVKGAPWPVTGGRARDLRAIGERLRVMRSEGRNPQIVVLQEAFSGEARAIARRAGYRFVIYGPGAAERAPGRPSDADGRFLRDRRFWHGEGLPRLFGSGLMLLSDYPVRDVHRVAFPDFACAGFDCMANKGAVMATIDIPGAPSPIDVVTTHLNSRRSARVSDARSNYAYGRQVELLARFIGENRNPDHPLIVAGDFNVGALPERGAMLSASQPAWSNGGPVTEALAALAAESRSGQEPIAPDEAAARRRNTDFEFVAAGRMAALTPVGASFPFGREPTGTMLSDHIGYSIAYRLVSPGERVASLSPPARASGGAGGSAR